MSTNRHLIEQEELMAYLDGELPTQQATEAMSHLDLCPECQTLAADFRSVSRELMAWEVESGEVDISPEINAALEERVQKRELANVSSLRLKNRVMTSRWVWAGALAIVCVAVGLKLTLTSRNRNEGASMGMGAVGDRSTAYPSMASIEQYLMPDRDAEIALARSAAPESISNDAKILVLGWRGYETAIEGKNGFVCMVERSWGNPFNSAEFWNPRIRVPECFNPAAARSILPLTFKRTDMVLAGLSKVQMIDSIKAGFDDKELPAPEPGAMCYMMSRAGYLNDAIGHHVPHLMFYFPLTDKSSWGADLPDSPVTMNPQFEGGPEPITEFVIPVAKWSDGTVAPAM
jgi:putative zinc finger protein